MLLLSFISICKLVLILMIIMSTAFWDVTPCCLVGNYLNILRRQNLKYNYGVCN
jgi:hypothetical protein